MIAQSSKHTGSRDAPSLAEKSYPFTSTSSVGDQAVVHGIIRARHLSTYETLLNVQVPGTTIIHLHPLSGHEKLLKTTCAG